MRWLWILPAAVLLLLMTRVGVWAAFDGDGTLRLALRAGPLRIRLLPAGKRRAERKEKPKKVKRREKPEKKPEKKKLPFTLEDGRDALRTMLPALERALRRTGRGVRVKPLRLSLTLGGQEDPAAAALLCGKLQAAVWTAMPPLERLMDIRDPYIHTGVDFESSATAAEGEAGVTLRIGTLLAVGLGLAVPALGWFLRFRKRSRGRPPKPDKKRAQAAPPEEPAA